MKKALAYFLLYHPILIAIVFIDGFILNTGLERALPPVAFGLLNLVNSWSIVPALTFVAILAALGVWLLKTDKKLPLPTLPKYSLGLAAIVELINYEDYLEFGESYILEYATVTSVFVLIIFTELMLNKYRQD